MSETSTNQDNRNAVIRYFSEVRGELRKVTWPTRQEAIRWTAIVIAVMVLMTIVLSSFDFLFSSGLTILVDTFLGVDG